MSTKPLIYSNHLGIWWSGDSICYCEYAGQDILFRHQFKIMRWLGSMSDASWSGHQAWDFDGALFFEGGGIWHFKNIFDGAVNEDGETISTGSRFIPYSEEQRRLLMDTEIGHGLDPDIAPERLLDAFFMTEPDAFHLINPDTPVAELVGPGAESIDYANTPEDYFTVFSKKIKVQGYVRLAQVK